SEDNDGFTSRWSSAYDRKQSIAESSVRVNTGTTSIIRERVHPPAMVEELIKLAGFQVHVTYDKDKYPLQHYMLKFFTALMAGVMYFFMVLIILELLRRLFPNFSFRKSPDDDHHSSK
ncbi:MAG: hypothetical protein Q8K43_03685, partial [Sulfurimicrobium sp.]|nr:hypothetical protein [Sulfurimicrobium sp.]